MYQMRLDLQCFQLRMMDSLGPQLIGSQELLHHRRVLSFLNRQSQVPDCHGDSFTASPQMPGVGFTARRPHTRLLLAEGGGAGGVLCRLQTRKLRHGLLLHGASHT